jgi:hypothetical protein
MFASLLLAAAITVGFAALPLSWGLRAWGASLLFIAWVHTLSPITPFQDQGPLDGLGSAVLGWFFLLATLGVVGKLFWTLAKAQLDLAELLKDMRGADRILAGFLGLFSGLVLTLNLAVEFRGFPGGLALHLAVASLALIASAVALRLPFLLRCVAVPALATVAILTLAGGFAYPELILSRADFIQPGAKRCLRIPEGNAPTIDQLRLLTLPKAEARRPNLVLTVMTDNGPKDFRWSYRSFAFRTYGSYEGGPCPSP